MQQMNLFAERVLCSVGQVSLTTALVILLLLALRKLLRRRYPARVLCLLWTVLIVRLLIPVQFSLPQAPVRITPRLTRLASAPEWAAGTGPEITEAPAVPGFAQAAPPEWDETAEAEQISDSACYGTVLFAVWCTIAVLLLARQLLIYGVYAHRIRKAAREADSPALLEIYRREREQLAIRRELPLLYSKEAGGPMLMGLFRPVVLFPETGIDPEAVPMVLRHELTHYQRRDLWRRLAAAAAQCVHWFNPVVYLLVRACHEDIELACDSRAVQGLDKEARMRYGKAILDCAADSCAAQRMLTTCFISGKESMKTRLSELFANGTKKRGGALLLLCILTMGIVGGGVSVGSGPRASEPAASDEQILSNGQLTGETAVLLAGAWGSANMGRSLEPAMSYLTRELQQDVFSHMADPETETQIVFDAADEHYGVPEENRRRFWFIGVSSPYISGYTVIPDLEHQAAYVVTNWSVASAPDTRGAEYLHFAREDGVWRISGIDGSPYADEGALLEGLTGAERFRLLYGNDLGLPDFIPYINEVSWSPEVSRDDIYYHFDDPVTAVRELLELGDGQGTVTGNVDVAGRPLGVTVEYSFTDGSVISFVVAELEGRGFLPVDWRMEEESGRSMRDLLNQWAAGVREKDAHLMFPLLTKAGDGCKSLLEEQEGFVAATLQDESLFWKYYRYHTSDVNSFDVRYLDENTAELLFCEGANHMYIQRLHFVTEDGRLRIDRWEEVTPTTETAYEWYAANYEPYFELFVKNSSSYNINSVNWDAEDIALLMTGTGNHDLVEAVPERVTERESEDGKERFTVVLRFVDGSGWVTAELERITDPEAAAFGWNISSLSVSEQP